MPVGFPDYYGGLTLPVNVAEGGTGSTSITAKAMLYGAGTSHLVETNIGTSGQVLQIDSVTLVPTFKDLSVSVSVITGILPVLHGGTGTATPALIAGTNIAISGTWPDQTVALNVTGDLLLARTDYAEAYITRPNTAGFKKIYFGVTGGGALDEFHVASALMTFTTPLPVSSGGTGTATPALIAGTSISITGAWPGQTINNTSSYASLADPLPVLHGGTGTATPALIAGTAISITGTWPGQTINNTSAYASLPDPLPVLHGGTGTATPSLVAGAHTSLSGTWPAQTVDIPQSVATTATPTFAGLSLVTTASSLLIFKGTNSSFNDIEFRNSSNTTLWEFRSGIGAAGQQNEIQIIDSIAGTAPFTIETGVPDSAFRLYSTGLLLGGGGLSLLSKYNGLALAGAGLPSIVAVVDLIGLFGAIAATTFYTPAAAGFYRVSATIVITAAATGGNIQVEAEIIVDGVTTGLPVTNNGPALPTGMQIWGHTVIYVDGSQPIKYVVAFTSVTGSITYNLHVRLEAL